MNNFVEVALVVLVSLIAGFCIGNAVGRESIAKDCQQLGGFYVGKTTFKCAEVK